MNSYRRISKAFNQACQLPLDQYSNIEIENRYITLLKWSVGTTENQHLYVQKQILRKTICIDDF